MREYRFWQVDAFSAERYKGNPAAIVFDGDSLSSDEMQTIARQFNLSETVFLCRPAGDADYLAGYRNLAIVESMLGHSTAADAAYRALVSRTPGQVARHRDLAARVHDVAGTAREERSAHEPK